MQKSRAALFTVSLLTLSLYAPLAAMIYLPTWYQWNCEWHGRCAHLGPVKQISIDNLTRFFQHREPLNSRWSKKETQHLTEVRGMYDVLAVVALFAVVGLIAGARASNLRRSATISLVVILSLLLILPVFGYFWRHIFHEVLFSNDLWRTDRGDITWYLTPRTLFRNAVIALVVVGVAINAALLAVCFWRARNDPTKP